MHIICPKNLLAENINIALRAVTLRTTLPILECILIVADSNSIRLLSNDLEMGIETAPIDSEAGAQILGIGSVALEAKMLAEIVRRLPDADVSISTDKNNLTHIRCGKSEFKLLGYSGEDFPYVENIEKDIGIDITAEDLKDAIRQTIFSAATDESKPAYTGELFDIRPSELNVVTVDGYRVSHRKVDINTNIIHSAIIPAKTLSEINKILGSDGTVSIYFTERQVMFETPSCTVISRLLEGDFIMYESVFTSDHTTIIAADRHDFIMALERASLISSRDAKKNPVKFEISEDRLVIKSNTESGASYEEMLIALEGPELEISFNPKYLIDALKAIDEDNVKLNFTASLSPCVMFGEENNNARFLVLPLRNMRT